ncbi:hypothetical protein JOB18_030395 [Solea senegalensis]|uniref:Uncharacterized protein n=1 Tax=Solea senegalensis TaxID=28829 RepID=A0AAV6QVE9_SOLSE|nr:hypothetical protein JOB18_030395 [Solea senegalensis]
MEPALSALFAPRAFMHHIYENQSVMKGLSSLDMVPLNVGTQKKSLNLKPESLNGTMEKPVVALLRWCSLVHLGPAANGLVFVDQTPSVMMALYRRTILLLSPPDSTLTELDPTCRVRSGTTLGRRSGKITPKQTQTRTSPELAYEEA